MITKILNKFISYYDYIFLYFAIFLMYTEDILSYRNYLSRMIQQKI